MAFFRTSTAVGLSVLSALCLTSTAHARDVSFSDCGQGEVKAVRIENCSDGACSVASGLAVRVDIDFVSASDAATPRLEGQVDFAGLRVPIPGFEADGCKATRCPVLPGAVTSLRLEVPLTEVSESMPREAKVALESERPAMTLRIASPSGKALACVRIPFRLVPEAS
jgi:hypothetical protein